MRIDALRRTLEDTVAAVRAHAEALDRIAAERTEEPGKVRLLERLGGRPSEDPS
ncbi:hypothetical protein [Mycobacterium adipatum]|uniref:hypothetical protein n=1 Tax=Mycobacterium adipatum TaxID=1682113 RepID=UPI000AC96606|nr:hypothetical protein [Mycobacterium adipatum]MBI5736396.1 hypothetical protein [Mycolicibacterium neoaurum]